MNMSVTIGDKKKVTEMPNLARKVESREDIRASEIVNYHLLICRL